jgi:hypothetical protein
VGAPHPLQEAAVTALNLPDDYYVYLRESYQARRDLLFSKVEEAGFKAYKPRGAYYILTDVAHWLPEYKCADDHEFAMFLVKEVGVATVPGSSFYSTKELGRTKIRFCFPKRHDMLIEQGRRLQSSPVDAPAGLMFRASCLEAMDTPRVTLLESSRSIFDAALAAGDVRPLVARALAGMAKPAHGRVLVVGAGKASGAMAAAVEEAWGDRSAEGVVAGKDGRIGCTSRGPAARSGASRARRTRSGGGAGDSRPRRIRGC